MVSPLFLQSFPSAVSMPHSATSLLLLLLPALASAAGTCTFSDGGATFDFSPLKGLSLVTDTQSTPPTFNNMTWTIDPCGPIEWPKEEKEKCIEGTHVCGIELNYRQEEPDKYRVVRIIPVAGNFGGEDTLSPTYTRLKTSGAEADQNKEGLRVELHGGTYPHEKAVEKQEAIVTFICDKDRTGLEGQKRDDGVGEGDEKSLKYIHYESGILKLEWKTKYACEQQLDDGGSDTDGGSHWGFFTWCIIIGFLLTAAYLIFGSWFNYNRYGARGWDLLPHGDTIRDLPYLIKDFARKVSYTLQGQGMGGRRAGYSAV